jgi:hypothetical protein
MRLGWDGKVIAAEKYRPSGNMDPFGVVGLEQVLWADGRQHHIIDGIWRSPIPNSEDRIYWLEGENCVLEREFGVKYQREMKKEISWRPSFCLRKNWLGLLSNLFQSPHPYPVVLLL